MYCNTLFPFFFSKVSDKCRTSHPKLLSYVEILFKEANSRSATVQWQFSRFTSSNVTSTDNQGVTHVSSQMNCGSCYPWFRDGLCSSVFFVVWR